LPADPLKTPVHIAPVWYFTAVLRDSAAVPDKFLRGGRDGAAIVVLFFLPARPKPGEVHPLPGAVYKTALAIFVVSFLVLGWLGTQPATPG